MLNALATAIAVVAPITVAVRGFLVLVAGGAHSLRLWNIFWRRDLPRVCFMGLERVGEYLLGLVVVGESCPTNFVSLQRVFSTAGVAGIAIRASSSRCGIAVSGAPSGPGVTKERRVGVRRTVRTRLLQCGKVGVRIVVIV